MKTARTILEEELSINRRNDIGDMPEHFKSIAISAMEKYRKEGRYFTPDEIAGIEIASYNEGYNADKQGEL